MSRNDTASLEQPNEKIGAGQSDHISQRRQELVEQGSCDHVLECLSGYGSAEPFDGVLGEHVVEVAVSQELF